MALCSGCRDCQVELLAKQNGKLPRTGRGGERRGGIFVCLCWTLTPFEQSKSHLGGQCSYASVSYFLTSEPTQLSVINKLTVSVVLDSSKLKEQADDNFKFDENGRKFSKPMENTVGKGEIARHEQFLLIPQCFQTISTVHT